MSENDSRPQDEQHDGQSLESEPSEQQPSEGGTFRIHNNISSLQPAFELKRSDKKIITSLTRLSQGLRVRAGSDESDSSEAPEPQQAGPSHRGYDQAARPVTLYLDDELNFDV